MISFENVDKWYGTHQCLTQINATVRKGEVVVLCGPSGSGKTTLIRTINRLERSMAAGSLSMAATSTPRASM